MKRSTPPPIASGNSDWKAIATVRRERIFSKIPKEWLLKLEDFHDVPPVDVPRRCGHLSDVELRVTELRAVDIVRMLGSCELKASEAVVAFSKRAAIAHQLVSEPSSH